ncbi:unnamed protein product [Cuscuta epithymum]|uniref:Uncharacterized protein n=1 Tax=Cuscuta epithymum TaxID=186058 RepID=A0AAV0FVT8_9ASTE|nr:unnamed protein product [Cuscuta epithymum]
MHSTLNPIEFMRGVMPSKDRVVLSRLDDDVLDFKIANYSTMAALGVCEQARRVEALRIAKAQVDEALKKSDEEMAVLRKKFADAEEALQLEREATEQRLKDAEARGKAAAEETAAVAAKTAAEAADIAKAEAVAEAGKKAVESFLVEGWMAADLEDWVASVVERRVDTWVGGPGAMWLAQKGKSYYEGGEYFTQANIYRKLARHFNIDPKVFKPEAYGLPPLQPDVRIPLPEGEERELLEDSELAKEADDEEVLDDAASRSKEGDREAAP